MLGARLTAPGPGHAAEPETRAAGPALGDLVVRSSAETSFYADSDHVTVVTPTLAASVENPLSGWSFGGRYLVDVVTAASADIVATATPPWRETRHGFSADIGYKPGDLAATVSASGSIEPDYVSLAGGVTLSWELAQKNVTVLLGYGYSRDTAGRSGTPFTIFSRTLDRHWLNGGSTWVVDRSTLATVVADAVLESGDPSKTYRYVPMFAPGTAALVPRGASAALVDELRAHERPLEQLPLSRGRFAATGRLAHRFSSSTLRLEERLYADTWRVLASTTDLQYVVDVHRRLSAGPHLRAHVQSGADFWQRASELVPGPGGQLVAPALRTGDRELGPLYTLTAGFVAECDLSAAGARAWVLRLEGQGISTEYLDALYLTQRAALFTALSLDVTLD